MNTLNKYLFKQSLIPFLLSVAVNFYSYYEERKNKSISNTKAFSYLLFDTLQLGFLLFLTGGIINPFSILILAPVITSASYLPALMTVILSTISIIIIICCCLSSVTSRQEDDKNFNVKIIINDTK